MTINIGDNDPRVSYFVAEGVTQTSFVVDFEFFDDADLTVYVDSTLKTLVTDYTVTGGAGSTGSISMSVTGASGGSTVVIFRSITLERTTDFPISGQFNISALNTELDRVIAVQADLKDQIDRSLKITDYDIGVDLTLPDVNSRKGRTLAFNETTGTVEAGPTISDVQTVSVASADIARLADIEDGTLATNAIQTVAGVSTNVATVAGIATDVTDVAAIDSNVTTVALDGVDIGIVSANISNVNTVAGISANVTTVAGISADVTTVAGISANTATVAGISADVTTVAGISANVTAVAADAVDIGTVSASIANVNTVSGSIASVNTAAANITDIQNAATNAATATTKAAEAATSASSAATSETNAAASASSALTAQTAAEAARDSALSAYDSFDDRYLGVKASDPTLDNDGNALVGGALYYNSTDEAMKVYTGSTWVAAYASLSGALLVTNNLSDLNDAASARTNLGLGTSATINVGTSANEIVQIDGTGKLPALDGSQLTGIVSIPTGLISLWSGSVASIPSGWVICDGLNGTPDLRDRFIVGAGSTYAVGATGGSASVTLAEAELPSHTHGVGNYGGNTGNSGNHSHNGSTSNTGSHNHTIYGASDNNAGGNSMLKRDSFGNNNAAARASNNTASNTGAHSHNFTTAGGGDHSHTLTLSGSSGATGSGTAHENRPPYYALAYIMKT